jgi:hypothetical protein
LIRRILTSLAVLAGCLWIGYVALYPPRRERLHAEEIHHEGIGTLQTRVEAFRSHRSDRTDVDREIPRISLFSDKPQYYSANQSPPYILTEIDAGRLLAEALLILALTGAAVAALNLWRPSSNQPLQQTGPV